MGPGRALLNRRGERSGAIEFEQRGPEGVWGGLGYPWEGCARRGGAAWARPRGKGSPWVQTRQEGAAEGPEDHLHAP